MGLVVEATAFVPSARTTNGMTSEATDKVIAANDFNFLIFYFDLILTVSTYYASHGKIPQYILLPHDPGDASTALRWAETNFEGFLIRRGITSIGSAMKRCLNQERN